MTFVIVCHSISQARRLYWKLVACLGQSTIFTSNQESLEVWFDCWGFKFITESALDIYLRGRRNVKVVRAADIEYILDKQRKK